jgi:hypothetical protein
MNDDAKTSVTGHLLIRDKTTGQVIVNKRLIQPVIENKKEVKDELPKSNG